MKPDLFEAPHRYTVSSLTRRLRSLLEGTYDFQEIWVEGEISNYARPSSGHVYFTLKDAGAQLRCVMWRNSAARVNFVPSDGMMVEAHGNLSIYEAGGQYQLYADSLRPLGDGVLYAEYLRLKTLLEKEGLFDPEHKKPIPEQPHLIGVITSPTGAALRDILNTLRRRYPLADVILAPAPVQGLEAPPAIITALEGLQRTASPDVIILARGGGSMEDLWAFNDEHVVRSVAKSSIPIITGIGHETDFTLVDFAADLRAPTPTAAAEIATPVTLADITGALEQRKELIQTYMQKVIHQRQEALDWMEERIRLVSPSRRFIIERKHLTDISHRLNSSWQHRYSILEILLVNTRNRLQALDPLAILQRGYAVVTRKDDQKTVIEISQVSPGDELQVRVKDGQFYARVSGI